MVGRPYHPGKTAWPEASDYNFRAGGHELRIFLANASKAEVAAAERGRVEFGLMLEPPELFVVARFHGPDDRVVMSFDCSYQWHRVSEAERTEPPAWEEISPDARALVSVVLVEATTGLILALRALTFSPEFTRSIHRAIADQAAGPYDKATHERAVDDITRRFNTDQLWDRCRIRCEGGA
jgi:hypothetical protein